jgi:hypothetical protein
VSRSAASGHSFIPEHDDFHQTPRPTTSFLRNWRFPHGNMIKVAFSEGRRNKSRRFPSDGSDFFNLVRIHFSGKVRPHETIEFQNGTKSTEIAPDLQILIKAKISLMLDCVHF